MKLHLDGDIGGNRVTGYGEGFVEVNAQTYTRSLVVAPDRIVADWPPGTVGEVNEGHLETLMGMAPEILLLGTGARQRFPAPSLLASAAKAGVGIEVMDTAAACRTYNILMGEGRSVIAALLIGRPGAGP